MKRTPSLFKEVWSSYNIKDAIDNVAYAVHNNSEPHVEQIIARLWLILVEGLKVEIGQGPVEEKM